MDLLVHVLQGVNAFANVPHEWYCIVIQLFAESMFFKINESLVNRTCCGDDDFTVHQCHRCRWALLGDYYECFFRVTLHIHDLVVGWSLLVEMCSCNGVVKHAWLELLDSHVRCPMLGNRQPSIGIATAIKLHTEYLTAYFHT